MSATLDDPRIAKGMRAQMELRRRRFNEGAHQVGWKVGLVLARAMLPSGSEVSLYGWQKPVAEAEIAAYIGYDLPAHASRDEVRRAVVAIGPAIELADVDSPMEDVEGVLSGDIFQRHV